MYSILWRPRHLIESSLTCSPRLVMSHMQILAPNLIRLTGTTIDVEAFIEHQYQSPSPSYDRSDGDPISTVESLLRVTVTEIRRFNGNQVMKSAICALLSTLSRPLADEIRTAFASISVKHKYTPTNYTL